MMVDPRGEVGKVCGGIREGELRFFAANLIALFAICSRIERGNLMVPNPRMFCVRVYLQAAGTGHFQAVLAAASLIAVRAKLSLASAQAPS